MIFEGAAPRVFGLPPGADFAAEVAAGLAARMADRPPQDMARVQVFVPTARLRARAALVMTTVHLLSVNHASSSQSSTG